LLNFFESQFEADGNSGSYKFGESVQDLTELFSFKFHPLPDNGAISIGKWNSEPGAHYEFLIHNQDSFTITVLPDSKDDDALVHLYIGKRVLYPVTQTFFQKYGSTIMIAGVFMLNMYMQQKLKGQQQNNAARANNAAAAPAAAAPTANLKQD
jgi:hypothetical protein